MFEYGEKMGGPKTESAPILPAEPEQPTEQEQTESTETHEEVPVSVQPTESDQSKNFRLLREKAERIERERDEALSRLRDVQSKSQVNTQPAEEDDSGMDPDSFIEGKHLNKTHKKIKKLEEQLRSYEQKSAEIATETRIKTQYPDFDKVVTKENIEALKAQYPELAHTLNPTNDLYGAAVSAYTLIRKLGIAPEDNFSQDRAAAQKNAMKPRPMVSVSPQQGESPLSRANAFANGLTDELREQLWREMNDARKSS